VKLSRIIFGSWITTCGLAVAAAAAPPLDRPSPPPCCADGMCHANPCTWGWYETRWRRWPCECLAGGPTPPGQLAPAQLGPEIQPYVAPPPEEEDRRAPLPTAPHGEPPRTLAPAGGAARPAEGETTRTPAGETTRTPAPEATRPPAGETPRVTPYGPPPGSERATPRGVQPYEPKSPGMRSSTPSGPTSDADPPPELPFGPGSLTDRPEVREAKAPAALPVLPPTVESQSDDPSDPPPALPTSLASMRG
jgi:hypothetical protein